eukprot:jgi/Picre1/27366/NNA_000333.t1
MRTIYSILLCVLLTLGASKAKHKNNNGQKKSSYSVDLPMPENLDEFIENQETAATTPQGGALIFIQALIEYSKGTDLGKEFMTHAIFEDDLVGGDLSRADRYRLARVHEFMARAYVDGTSPEPATASQTRMRCGYDSEIRPNTSAALPQGDTKSSYGVEMKNYRRDQ